MSAVRIVVNVGQQSLRVYDEKQAQLAMYTISTAKNGTGQHEGSGCTPLGRHHVAQKIGEGLPVNAVLVARQYAGEIYNEALGLACPERDWILTRILWLSGDEVGFNQGDTEAGVSCDSFNRYIYIHGTPDSEPMGTPCSHGCIRMRNADVLALFDAVSVGTVVEVVA